MTRRTLFALAAFPMAAQTPTPTPQYKPGDLLFVNQAGTLQAYGTYDPPPGTAATTDGNPHPPFQPCSAAEYKAEYAICTVRGHLADPGVTSVAPCEAGCTPWQTCYYCRTQFRTVETKRLEEQGAPQ